MPHHHAAIAKLRPVVTAVALSLATGCASGAATMAGGTAEGGDMDGLTSDRSRRLDAGALTVAFGALNSPARAITLRADAGRPLLHVGDAPGSAVVWLDGVDFETGTLEVDLRGQDVFQRSFIGIAFAGADDSTFEAVYLRPFNFRAPDSTRHAHAVQYEAPPTWPWNRLRAERSGEFEGTAATTGAEAPTPGAWVRLRLEVERDLVRVHLNDAPAPALVVTRLGERAGRRVGYMLGDQSPGDFRPMVVRREGRSGGATGI